MRVAPRPSNPLSLAGCLALVVFASGCGEEPESGEADGVARSGQALYAPDEGGGGGYSISQWPGPYSCSGDRGCSINHSAGIVSTGPLSPIRMYRHNPSDRIAGNGCVAVGKEYYLSYELADGRWMNLWTPVTYYKGTDTYDSFDCNGMKGPSCAWSGTAAYKIWSLVHDTCVKYHHGHGAGKWVNTYGSTHCTKYFIENLDYGCHGGTENSFTDPRFANYVRDIPSYFSGGGGGGGGYPGEPGVEEQY